MFAPGGHQQLTGQKPPLAEFIRPATPFRPASNLPQLFMPERFYEPGPARAEKVKALFARIASRYDLINDLQSFGLHRRWKKRVIVLAGVGAKAGKALDVCCGTGDLALGLAQCRLQVIGLDFSESMLRIAQMRAKSLKLHALGETLIADSDQHCLKTGHSSELGSARRTAGLASQAATGSVSFVAGDAQKLPFRENEFDVVTVGYGLRNLADWERGLNEMHRVTKPEGKVLVLEFGKPENPIWRRVYFVYLRLFVPVLGLLFCGSAGAYSYILESLRHYPAQHGVAARMRELGMRDVGIIRFLGGAMTINYGEKAAGG